MVGAKEVRSLFVKFRHDASMIDVEVWNIATTPRFIKQFQPQPKTCRALLWEHTSAHILIQKIYVSVLNSTTFAFSLCPFPVRRMLEKQSTTTHKYQLSKEQRSTHPLHRFQKIDNGVSTIP